MNGEVVVAVVAVAAIGVAYLERKNLEVAFEADVQKLITLLRSKESAVRAKISGDVAKVIADAKAEAEKIQTDAKAEVSKALAKLEADIKKVL